MSSDGRLPEDLAAEQAYLAELRAQREEEERMAAAARRAQLAAQGLLDAAEPSASQSPAGSAPAAPSAQSAPGAQPGSIPLEQLARLSPELIAQLPPEIREALQAVQQRSAEQPAGTIAALEPPPPGPAASSNGEGSWINPQPAAPPPGPEQLSEEELARREAAVLAKVRAELAETDSPLTGSRRGSFFQRAAGALDNLVGMLFGRKSTW